MMAGQVSRNERLWLRRGLQTAPDFGRAVTGYKLREMEVKQELKDKFWGAEVPDKS